MPFLTYIQRRFTPSFWLWAGVPGVWLAEIRAVKASCSGHILKVIVEACQLTQEEKIAACRIVSISGADFIKTSTGFSTGGATVEDVKLFRVVEAIYFFFIQ